METESIEPKLSVQPAGEWFGFLVEDKNNPVLNMRIKSSFMQEKKEELQRKGDLEGEKIAREGNLNVTIGKDARGQTKILSVILD